MKFWMSACLYCFFSQMAFAEHTVDLAKLEYLTESYPPYNYIEDGEFKGIAIDLLNAALLQASHKPQDLNIRLFPWPRAYKMILKGSNRVLFSTTRTQEREPLFQWAGPITSTKIVLIALTEEQINIQSIEQLAQYSIGTIKDDIGEQLLLSSGFPLSQIRQAHSAESLVRMLSKGRIQLWAYEENVARWYIANSSLPNNRFTSVFTLKESELFYAFSKDTDPKLVASFQDAIDKLKRPQVEGSQSRYDKILSQYQ
ncbi:MULTISPECIES: substrate-binding periplasmic protein [Shewanella]|nr:MULTISPECIES: transporter substrate-binding domain-containing protein [Shewanella]